VVAYWSFILDGPNCPPQNAKCVIDKKHTVEPSWKVLNKNLKFLHKKSPHIAILMIFIDFFEGLNSTQNPVFGVWVSQMRHHC
jgi:hypothetical protein